MQERALYTPPLTVDPPHMISWTPSSILLLNQLFFISINFFTKLPSSCSSCCLLSVIFQIANLFISTCFLISTSYAFRTLIYSSFFPFIYTFSDSFVTPPLRSYLNFFFNTI